MTVIYFWSLDSRMILLTLFCIINYFQWEVRSKAVNQISIRKVICHYSESIYRGIMAIYDEIILSYCLFLTNNNYLYFGCLYYILPLNIPYFRNDTLKARMTFKIFHGQHQGLRRYCTINLHEDITLGYSRKWSVDSCSYSTFDKLLAKFSLASSITKYSNNENWKYYEETLFLPIVATLAYTAWNEKRLFIFTDVKHRPFYSWSHLFITLNKACFITLRWELIKTVMTGNLNELSLYHLSGTL